LGESVDRGLLDLRGRDAGGGSTFGHANKGIDVRWMMDQLGF
jgi:hypothetical protein